MKLNIKKHLLSLVRGEAVDGRFFKDNLFITCFVVISAVAVIGARFSHATAEAKARGLRNDIEVARTEKQRECSQYMTFIRETHMKALVDSLHLGLVISGENNRELHLED